VDTTSGLIVNAPKWQTFRPVARALELGIKVRWMEDVCDELGLVPTAAPINTAQNHGAQDHDAQDHGAQNQGNPEGGGGRPLTSEGKSLLATMQVYADSMVVPRGARVPLVIVKAMVKRQYCSGCALNSGMHDVGVKPLCNPRFPGGAIGCTRFPDCNRLMKMGEIKGYAAMFDSDYRVI